MRNFTFYLLLSTLLVLAGCGGSSSDDTSSTYTTSYIQLYNGSANSTSTRLILTDDDDVSILIGSATYTDATSLISYTPDSYDIALSRLNSAGDDVSILESTLQLKQSYKHLLLLSGDYASPDLLSLSFLRDDSLTDTFKLYVVNLLPDTTAYDLYISDSDGTFDDATLVSTLNYQQISEPMEFSTGSYIVYLTIAGSRDVLFSSASYSFSYLTEYVLVPRQASGPLQGNVAIDVISNTTTVTHLTDIEATAQFRLYNSIDNDEPTDIFLNDSVLFTALPSDVFSDYAQLDAADYRLSAIDLQGQYVMKNALLTLNQGQSKAVVLYKNSDDVSRAIVVEESELPQIYDFDVNVVNIINDYTSLSLYFVPPADTIDTTDYAIATLNRGAQTDINLPDGAYRILLVFTDSNKNNTLLAESELQQFEAGKNYLLVAEPDSNNGYKLSLLH
ncbi:hypothetical protein [Rheinheimera baltica]|uniref:DUF4397 domain-containing protein n=1 Tax=Rheinheimera baltica TaxID=67576 RepID=A0ABT9I4W4_9GAMM|nr:hypothetical protein [Rheinheimera baltica]MDP5138444.1 hypothetical protein [Rheinheimera baltica]MDP5150222.1 hypothetical protein [Rheinheimera baltica]MDP5190479.1 hypothetical protein [Rheinheimera baltica]